MSNETDKLLDLQIEVIQISIYCDIVKNLLLKHRSISVIKIISFSFIIKKRQHLQGSVYKGNNKVDLVLKFLSKEWLFVFIINGNIKPCEMEVIQSVSSLTTSEHIPKGIIPTVENTENIITTSASHNKITA